MNHQPCDHGRRKNDAPNHYATLPTNAIMHFVRTFSIMRAYDVRLIAIEGVRNFIEKLYASKTFLKMVGGRMHTPHPNPLDSPLAISYRNHQKNLAYFSHLAPLILFFLLKGRVKREGHGTMVSPLNTLLWTGFRQ